MSEANASPIGRSHQVMKNFWSRREFLFQSGGGMSGLALAYLLHKDGLLAAENNADCNSAPLGGNPYAPKPPHFKARAKAVISLFMTGGPSHVDTFDPKPALAKYADQDPPESLFPAGRGRSKLLPSPFKFQKCGQSGFGVERIDMARTAGHE